MSELLRVPAILLAITITITSYIALGGDAGLRVSTAATSIEQTA